MDMMQMALIANLKREVGAPMKVFDWDKAKTLIRSFEKEWKTDVSAEAYLREDEGNTRGVIYEDGEIVLDDHPYTASIWATPMLRIYYNNKFTEIECFNLMHDYDAADDLATRVWPNL